MEAENQSQNESQSQNQSSSETLQSRFERERKVYKDRVSAMSAKMQKVNTLSEVLVDALSTRQEVVDYAHTIMDLLSKLNVTYKKKRKKRREYYTMDYDQKLSDKVIDQYIDVDLEADVYKVDTLNNHLSYLNKTVDTIDKLVYAVNWRMKLEEYKLMNH